MPNGIYNRHAFHTVYSSKLLAANPTTAQRLVSDRRVQAGFQDIPLGPRIIRFSWLAPIFISMCDWNILLLRSRVKTTQITPGYIHGVLLPRRLPTYLPYRTTSLLYHYLKCSSPPTSPSYSRSSPPTLWAHHMRMKRYATHFVLYIAPHSDASKVHAVQMAMDGCTTASAPKPLHQLLIEQAIAIRKKIQNDNLGHYQAFKHGLVRPQHV